MIHITNKTYEKAQDLYDKAKHDVIPINMVIGRMHTMLLESDDPHLNMYGMMFSTIVHVYSKSELIKICERDYPVAWHKQCKIVTAWGMPGILAHKNADYIKASVKSVLKQARAIDADWVQIARNRYKVIPANYHCLDRLMKYLKIGMYKSYIEHQVHASMRKHAHDNILRAKEIKEPDRKAPNIDGAIYGNLRLFASTDEDGNYVMPKCSLKLAVSLNNELMTHHNKGVNKIPDVIFDSSLYRMIDNGNIVVS